MKQLFTFLILTAPIFSFAQNHSFAFGKTTPTDGIGAQKERARRFRSAALRSEKHEVVSQDA
jgi:hypothetical protein